MDPRGFGRRWGRAKGGLGYVLLLGVAACGGGARSPACSGYDSLVDALRAVAAAETAVSKADDAALDRAMSDVERYVRQARSRLSSAEADPSTAAGARAMLEAANYLDFMAGDFRSTGNVDFSLTQFASRELNSASAGAGGAPLNC